MANRFSLRLIFASVFVFLLISTGKLMAEGGDKLVLFEKNETGFVLSDEGRTATIILGSDEYKGVKYVTNLFVEDLKRIGLAEPKLVIGDVPAETNIVLIGTVGQNPVLDELEKSGKLDLSELRGQWEKSLVQVVENPFPGVDKALVLAGSDKRGTIYAMLNLSRAMGVSPWYWWADVPVNQHSVVSINPGRFVTDSPKVNYRGIFLNDEEPALGGWVRDNFGDFNGKFYSHVFELILRLRGNYLWPAMWGKAFFDDDPENGRLADELGVVIGTSHHEPLGRAHDEWRRYGSGPWDFSKNAKVLTDFWAKGMERMKDYETIVTVGMRGDGDEAMSEGTNIALLEKIVRDQRKIISKVTGKKAEETPQMWALYKEVQDYYDRGMRVPDDVTLLLCDDNWGDVRKLPNINPPAHPGGYGMYYHFDYVGGPRNYKWTNVSQIQRVWEQMNLTYSHGVDKVWIVNVGDLKPMEYPISFFLDMAWNPDQFNAQNLFQHTVNWCAEQFGENYAEDAARVIDLYTKYNHRVTPELLDENTFSLENYNEFERVRNDYRGLALEALRLYNLIPNASKDAFDQLVLFPTNACSNLYEMYYAVARNHQLAAANNPEANDWAAEVQQCFDRDSLLTVHYNQQIAGGKWNHQMDQIRIGYIDWQQPDVRKMPEVFRVEVPEIPNSEKVFVEEDGYISIPAENFQEAKGTRKIHWEVIPELGKTGSAITTFPQNEYPAETDSVYLQYAVQFKTTGKFDVHVLVSPSLNFNANKGLRYAISVDNGEEQIVNMNGEYRGELGQWQADRIIEKTTQHEISAPGVHQLRIRVLEPGIVLQKILIDCGGLKPSFLGAPQSELIKPD
ncbi:glycosyl hydrolase 115 family protein [Mangrovibacterium lignilyticum]|uniref:glycosyl hydrolase 115 family protein n=1 Tax=Mangrovibacterium lignilyticum TaxID=2668052 RepID=UPI001EE54F56|nr:glycosyl hydrolase 115 family protein [Mangrovibacterium lignilyticum]